MAFKNPWGKGSKSYDRWFKNPWDINNAKQNHLFDSQKAIEVPKGSEDDEAKSWAWVPTKSWSDTYIQKYREYVAKTKFESVGHWTCEDLALFLIINFCNSNLLPFKWQTGGRLFDVTKNPEYYGHKVFMYDVMTMTGALDFDRSVNSIEIPLVMVSPGDMILLDQGDHDGVRDHVQVVTEVVTEMVINSATNTGNFRVTRIYGVQGENNRSIQTDADRDKYDADPRASNYIGSSLEYFSWNLKDDTYKNITRNESYTGANDLLRPKYVRFNFNSWN